MTDQYIERVENIIRVVNNVRDEDFNLWRWCDCAIGHAMRDSYFIALRTDPTLETLLMEGQCHMREIGKFFNISAERAGVIFMPGIGGNYESRKDVLAALRVLLLEKMAQQIDDGVKSWSTPHIEELVDATID